MKGGVSRSQKSLICVDFHHQGRFFFYYLLSTYFYITRHALKPKHKIHVWSFYIPMYQCAMSGVSRVLKNPRKLSKYEFDSFKH